MQTFRVEIASKETGEMFCYHATYNYKEALALLESYFSSDLVTANLVSVIHA
jgi:hypothetical protein